MTADISIGWKEARLGDVADILDSKRVPINSKERQTRQGDIPYYGATGQVGWIDAHLFDEELVLLGEDGAPFLDSTRPKAYLIRGKSWVNNHAHVLRAKNGLLNSFLLYQLNCLNYRTYVSGTTRLKLPQGPMREIPILVAPLDEQRRIVAEIEEQLSRLEAGVAALKRVQANLKRYRDASVLEAVTGTTASLRKNWDPDQKPSLPRSWRWVALSEVAEVSGGLAKSAGRKTAAPTRAVPYLRVANVQRGHLDLTEIKTIEATEAEIEDLCLKPGDVLFNEGGDRDKLGRGWVWSGEIAQAIHQNHVFRARPDTAKAMAKFLSYCGNSYGASWFWRHGKQSVNLASVSLRTLRSFPIALPPLEVQQRIVTEIDRRLSVVEELETQVRADLARAERLRQATLTRAFAPGDRSR